MDLQSLKISAENHNLHYFWRLSCSFVGGDPVILGSVHTYMCMKFAPILFEYWQISFWCRLCHKMTNGAWPCSLFTYSLLSVVHHSLPATSQFLQRLSQWRTEQLCMHLTGALKTQLGRLFHFLQAKWPSLSAGRYKLHFPVLGSPSKPDMLNFCWLQQLWFGAILAALMLELENPAISEYDCGIMLIKSKLQE